MLVQTLHSGIPGTLTNEPQQDDLLHNNQATAGVLPVSWSPNVICRVYVPPTRHWEQRNGATFGYRTGLVANEEYWPGIFLHLERVQKDGKLKQQVRAWIRADNGGRDMPSLTFEPETWITMGISHTPDGAVHFFPGGRSEHSYIELSDGRTGVYTVEVNALTGHARIYAQPLAMLGLAALAFATVLVVLGLTAAVFARTGAARALALGFMASQRNMGLMVAATAGDLPELVWLYFAFCQFPIYLLPQLLKPLARRTAQNS